MKKTLLILFVILLTSCGSNSTGLNSGDSNTGIPSDVVYSVIKEENNENVGRCNLEIRLNKKIDVATLTNIANELRSTRKEFDKLWIGYFLPDMKTGNGAWATTHFIPELEVQIIGTENSQDKVMLDSAIAEGEIYGKWKDSRPMAESIYIIYKDKSDNTQMKKVLPDGSSYLMEMKSMENNTKFISKEDVHGESFLIESNGNLGMYGTNGKFGECENVNAQ